MEVQQRAFRDAMGCFATGITLVTTVSGAGLAIGVTVNSFNSVSLEPPLILFSLSRIASTYPIFREAGQFTVNILRDGQQEISDRFAKPGQFAFEDLPHDFGDNGCPVVRDALAVFECSKQAELDGGDHLILLGRVRRVRAREDGQPLLYYRGRYGSIGP